MIQNSTDSNGSIDDSFYQLVLMNLKYIQVNGLFLTDEVRYVYGWDKKKSIAANRSNIMKEDAALKYFLDSGVVDGIRRENAYRNQELKARSHNPDARVWANWDEVDPAYREYEWVVLIHGINSKRLEAEASKFKLEDTGKALAPITNRIKLSPTILSYGQFTAHKDGSVGHKGKPIQMKPTSRKLVYSLLLKKGGILSYEQIIDALWEDDDRQSYLDDPERTTRNVKKRIANIANEANGSLFAYGNKKHLIASGETSYKFVV